MKKTGHWLVTPPRGGSRKFQETDAMVAFVKARSGLCMISWIWDK